MKKAQKNLDAFKKPPKKQTMVQQLNAEKAKNLDKILKDNLNSNVMKQKFHKI